MTGQGGWPLNVFLTPEQVPFYAGTYFPPEPRHGHAELAPGARGGRRGVGRAARRDPRRRGARSSSACAAARCCEPSPRDLRRAACSTRRSRRCASRSTPTTAASAARRSSRPPRRSSSCCAAARREVTARRRCGAMAAAGMYDQVGGGFARYSVDARWLVPHFEKMLYDNALLARAYLHGWQVTGDPLFRRGRARRRSTGRCARCAAPRAASTRRSTPTPRAWRASSTSGRSTSCATARAASRGRGEPGSARPSAATSRARTSSRAAPGEPGRSWTSGAAKLYECALAARLAGARRQAPDLLERADDLRAGRRGRGARARPTTWTPRASCADFVLARDARRRAAGCCAPGRTARGQLNAYLEDHAFLLEALLAAVRGDASTRAGSPRPRALADTMIERFADDERGGFFETSSRPRAAGGAAQGPRGPPDPVRQLERGLRPAAAGRADRRARLRGARRGRAAACCTRSRPGTRRRSGTCCRRSTSTSPPVQEVALVGPTSCEPLERVVRGALPARTSCSPAASRTACRCSRAASRSTAAPPPTCASTSPAGAPVTEPDELEALLA